MPADGNALPPLSGGAQRRAGHRRADLRPPATPRVRAAATIRDSFATLPSSRESCACACPPSRGRRRNVALECRRMKILVVGGGGREHALCSSLHRGPLVEEL